MTGPGRTTTNGSHVHRMTDRRVRRPADIPAASPRLRRRHSPWPPDRRYQPATKSTRPIARACTAPRPISTRFEPVHRLRDVIAGSSRTPSRLASRTRPVWQSRAVPSLSGLLSTLPGVPQVRLPSASAGPLRRPAREVSHLPSDMRRLMAHKVKRPHVIGPLRPQPVPWHGGIPAPVAFASLRRHPQPLLPPQPLGPLAVDLPALLQQALMRLTVSPPRPLTRERPQLSSQRRVILDHRHDVALGRAVLPRQPTRPTLGEPEPFLKRQDGTTPPGRAQKFPADSSFSPWISSA